MKEYLRKTRLFSAASDGLIAWLEKEIPWSDYKKGSYLFYEGDKAERMYVIAKGRVKVVKEFASGKNAILGIFGPGSIIAEAPIFDGLPYPASAVALEDTQAGAVSAQTVRQAIKMEPEMTLKIIVGLGAKMRELTGNIGSLSTQNVEKRLARLLYKLSLEIGVETKDGLSLTLPMTRRDVAEIIGTSFEVVERCLKKMRENKIIRVDVKKILICDKVRLQGLFEE